MSLSFESRSIKSVAIIGGGLSGLSVAEAIQRIDPEVAIDLFEASQRWGGVLRTERVGDYLVEHAADMVSIDPGDAIDQMIRVGLEDELIEPFTERRGARIFVNGQLHPIPEGFVLMQATDPSAMLRTPLLSPFGRARHAFERFIPRRDPSLGDESVASFAQRRMGRQVAQRIVAPLAAGIYTADVEKLSRRATKKQFARMEDTDGSLFAATRRRKREGG
ncbi:MAG: protoporphyrinogen oxidase, partial [Planctomycetota bacterium]